MPSSATTFALSGLLTAGTSAVLLASREALAASKAGTFAGGAGAALVFFFALCAVGGLADMMRTEVGWIAAGIALVVAETVAGQVHPVCTTVCFLFSAVIALWVQGVAGSIYWPTSDSGSSSSSSSSSSGGKRKKR